MKICEICKRETMLYIHSSTRDFTLLTGRKSTMYGNRFYVVCHECFDILKTLFARYGRYIKNAEITEYKRQKLYMKNIALLPKPYKIDGKTAKQNQKIRNLKHYFYMKREGYA